MHLELSDSNYRHCPSRYVWEKARKIGLFLSVFYDITCIFSGTKYLTSKFYFPAIFRAYITIIDQMSSTEDYMKRMAQNMFSKFEKYWSKFYMILSIAVVLDPRHKLNLIDWCYKRVYGERANEEFFKLKEKLFCLYRLYGTTPSQFQSTSSSSSHGGSRINREAQNTDISLRMTDPFEVFHFIFVHYYIYICSNICYL
ncbi:Putative AC transposase [Apostasia shenzhenica]|uniref:AC transposase n=1 Tax=Apostasia shenzhenica TaxID=1088818 RepID=A0A2I0AEY7_9ASPA|nr:Putative AC transposase [Apostasia shenzhenica]